MRLKSLIRYVCFLSLSPKHILNFSRASWAGFTSIHICPGSWFLSSENFLSSPCIAPGWLVGWLAGWLVGWVGWLVGWLVGRSVGWLVGCKLCEAASFLEIFDATVKALTDAGCLSGKLGDRYSGDKGKQRVLTLEIFHLTTMGPPKPIFLEVFMVNNLVFRWPKPLFFMVLGAHGISIAWYPKQACFNGWKWWFPTISHVQILGSHHPIETLAF